MSTASETAKETAGEPGVGPRERRFGSRFWSGPRQISILFASLVALFCGWALSLPVFPTQDGPVHKYYVQVIASLLSRGHAYGDYTIRHPLPPYATHYLLLLGLTRFFSFDIAEKILICLIFFGTAYGIRYCARSFGPSGDLLSLCAVPLVLNWSVVMGFLNYSLAVGLFFLAAGLWNRAAERKSLWLAFGLVVVVLTLTHPVPLLLLVAFCLLDLLVRMAQDRGRSVPAPAAGVLLKTFRWQIFGLAVACISFLYPIASADRSRSISDVRSTIFIKQTILSSLALSGISPFDTRSGDLLVNCYRLGLCVLLVACLALAARGFMARWRARHLRGSDIMLIGTVGLILAIPILPTSMNGSFYFSQRLVIFIWLGGIAAASGYINPGRLTRIAPIFAVGFALITLWPAEVFMRPVARQLAALERQAVPQGADGLAIFDLSLLKAVRTEHQLGFNPYMWSGVLPFLHGGDVMLNSPWLDLTIMPLQAAPSGGLLINYPLSAEDLRRQPLTNGSIDFFALPPAVRSRLLASTRLLLFVGTPLHVQQGLPALVGASQAARFTCSSQTWYLVCTAP